MALAAAWQLLYESAYDLLLAVEKTPSDTQKEPLLKAALNLRQKADWIYTAGTNIDPAGKAWAIAWAAATRRIRELDDSLPLDSRKDLVLTFSSMAYPLMRRELWSKAILKALKKPSWSKVTERAKPRKDVNGKLGEYRQTVPPSSRPACPSYNTLHPWLEGDASARLSDKTRLELKDFLLAVLPANKQDLANNIPE